MSEHKTPLELTQINVMPFVRTKGNFQYLSWSHAIHAAQEADPGFSFEVHDFPNGPCWLSDTGAYVRVTVKMCGRSFTWTHPVLDNRNKPIPKPNAMEVNTSTMRCLVKCIALHGIGLSVYAGEDLSQYDDVSGQPESKPQPKPAERSRQAQASDLGQDGPSPEKQSRKPAPESDWNPKGRRRFIAQLNEAWKTIGRDKIDYNIVCDYCVAMWKTRPSQCTDLWRERFILAHSDAKYGDLADFASNVAMGKRDEA